MLVLGAFVLLGLLSWRVFIKGKAVFSSLVDAAADAGDAGEAATTGHRQWRERRHAADDRYQAALQESARPGPRDPLPGVQDLPPKG